MAVNGKIAGIPYPLNEFRRTNTLRPAYRTKSISRAVQKTSYVTGLFAHQFRIELVQFFVRVKLDDDFAPALGAEQLDLGAERAAQVLLDRVQVGRRRGTADAGRITSHSQRVSVVRHSSFVRLERSPHQLFRRPHREVRLDGLLEQRALL